MRLRRLISIPVVIVAIFGALAVDSAAAPQTPPAETPDRVFMWRQAERARRLAREECKPLVVHFVPDSRVGADQFKSYYTRPGGVPRDLLEKVVIVVAPTERFRGFARQLGVTGAGGYRTISAYDLSPMDEKSQPTCRSGFV